MPDGASVAYGMVHTLAFLCELAMLGTLGVSGWDIGGGALMSIAQATLYPAVAILIWSVLMAPTSRRRLADPWRLIAQIALFLATGAVAALAGHLLWGVVVAAVSIATFVAVRLFDSARASVG